VKTDSSGFVHVSLRIPEELRKRLNEEAKSRHITLNSLISAILAKYDAFDKILEGTNAIPLSEAFFEELLETTSMEEIESIANKLGAKVVRRSFAFVPVQRLRRGDESQTCLYALARSEVDRVLEAVLRGHHTLGHGSRA